MLAAAAVAVLVAITRLAGAKPTQGLGPAGLAALLATVAAALVAYRIIQEPGLDQVTTVKLGAPLSLLPLAMIAIGASSALRADDRAAETETEERRAGDA
jgi:integral membrane sensor domain MASE1